jgi:hypothetical protein
MENQTVLRLLMASLIDYNMLKELYYEAIFESQKQIFYNMSK